jgi:hypothetical protein
MSLQDELNRLALTTNRTNKDCLNILAGTTANPRSSQIAANIYAGTTGLSVQEALNVKANVTSRNLSRAEAAKLIPID